MVETSTSTYKSEKQKLLALPALKGRGARRPTLDAPPPYAPVAGRYEMTLSDNGDTDDLDSSDTASTWSTASTCSSGDTYMSATSDEYSSTTTSAFSSPAGYQSTSSYTSYAEGFATIVTLTTRVVPIAQLPPAYFRCPSCADGYAAVQLGLSCPHNCMPASTR
ncbi:hypothetical protein CC85DRAFT_312473 [Cutaneotrichosporon oleaginosum]|uniref:Uncharacterized protein n=1 Tax=Cutaneotrichosporon oleaginosum TaxID=879819 RepID=A0A0J0XLN4_9TREE|nr:uncharacterized protein CC85DRAFT_312473 [Cutaneotrichosporon oleaginosum]KLT42007.1 hypothetical protein CC85DRAFT_312473 [Cutaneotrichosporon oleaginosum]